MEKQITKTEKEMTVSELGKIVIKLNNKLNVRMEKTENLIEDLAQATSRIFLELREFKEETRENFARVRRDILDIRDTFTTKDELNKVAVRVEVLESNKK
jgi:hypothetical protein